MKKAIKLAALAIVAMSVAVACNSKNSQEEALDTIDSMPADTIVAPMLDTLAQDTVAPATVKKAVKKAATATKKAVDNKKVTVEKEGERKAAVNGGLKATDDNAGKTNTPTLRTNKRVNPETLGAVK